MLQLKYKKLVFNVLSLKKSRFQDLSGDQILKRLKDTGNEAETQRLLISTSFSVKQTVCGVKCPSTLPDALFIAIFGQFHCILQ